jgi:DNA-binding transcriptional LysR family regulator
VLNDRTVDLIDEGFEAAIRVGRLRSGDLIARPLQPYGMLVCASPAYLRSHGTPKTPDDLLRHECLGFSLGSKAAWRFSKGGKEWSVPVRGRLQVNSGQALRVAALHGMGIVRQPAALLGEDVAAHRLVRLLPAYELPSQPMHLVYLQDRYRSPRLRSFVDFIVERFGPAGAIAA